MCQRKTNTNQSGKNKEKRNRKNILSVKVVKIYQATRKCTAVKLHTIMEVYLSYTSLKCIINALSNAS